MTYTQPLLLTCLVVLFIGIARLRRCKGVSIPAIAAVALALISWPPVDWLVSRPLEAGYSGSPQPGANIEAIVVLGSSILPPDSERPYAVPDNDTYTRCEHAAWLYKHWKSVPVLASGGHYSPGALPVAAVMRELLLRAGVPDTAIITEELSRSTHENAVFGAAALRKRGITKVGLVVEAYAMPRAERAFRKEGLKVVPAPCSFRTIGPAQDELIPTWKAVARNENTLHEVLGLAWYALRGWI